MRIFPDTWRLRNITFWPPPDFHRRTLDPDSNPVVGQQQLEKKLFGLSYMDAAPQKLVDGVIVYLCGHCGKVAIEF